MGAPMANNSYSIGGMKEYFACLRNPHWQMVLKAWVKAGIDRGLDGFIANYFYRHDCHCEHCQKSFRDYLTSQHSAADLKAKFSIDDLAAHQFDELVCWHKPEESTPLRREMLRWSQISNKEAFDAVFHDYGRALKHDLITAMWGHLSNFSQIRGDERCMLPADMWGKDESYLWYSLGASGVYTDLPNGIFADGTLQARYIRGAFDDKPFTLGKYEGVRTRAAISELAANGGSPMGFYARTKDAEAADVFGKYYGFLERYKRLYHANQSHAEIAVLFPRKAVHDGDIEPLDAFREAGKDLLNQQLLFDVIPDDLTESANLERYAAVLSFDEGEFALPDAVRPNLSKIEAPDHVRVAANRPAGGGEIDLHFVNYNRVELPRTANDRPNPGSGTADENPIPVGGIEVEFVIPAETKVTAVEVIEPEQAKPQKIRFKVTENRVAFSMPAFRVYSVARIKLTPKPARRIPRIAGITTEHRHNSHSDMLIGRLVETDTLDNEGNQPPLKLVSLYTDQVNERDTSRALAEEHKFKIFDTVDHALTNGTGKGLAVDGVMLVAEHGKYPESDTGQFVFPKRRLFTEIVEVFKRGKKVVPVFSDKHLADNWDDAKWIYDTAKEHEIPLMAGSSLPVLWRYPQVDVRRGAKLDEIVAVSYGRLDSYGFHALEMIQCLVERRAGGETGITRVRCVTGPEVWTSDLYDQQLLAETLDRLWDRRRLNRGKSIEELVKEPVMFVIEYRDGLRASVLTLNGAVAEWACAWKYEDGSKPAVESTLFSFPEARPYFGFAHQLRGIEFMFQTGKPAWPVERTLLTSGALDAVLRSKRDGGDWLETPWLDVSYTSEYNWSQPPPPPMGRPVHEE